MSDVFWQAIIAGAVTIVIAWMQQRTKQAVKDSAAESKATANIVADHVALVAEKVESAGVDTANQVREVKDTLAGHTTTTAAKLEELKSLTNGLSERMGDAREAKGKAQEQVAQRDRDEQSKLEHKPGDVK